jgi:dipeptidyl aminopeptidase/acylaminoacyl peptidase
VPGEREAGDRTWEVVRGAYAERVPSPRARDKRLLVAVAIGVALLAAALSPPGHAVWGSLRDAVQEEDHLVALPSGGRVLVTTPDGAWVVARDGSKRFLAGYHDAAWSPHGLFVAAARANQLVAMEPDGDVHWKLARRARISAPRWSFDGFRIAYFADRSLRVVNGDGTGDRLIARRARRGSAAWMPRSHVLAYVDTNGAIVSVDVDTKRVIRRFRPEADVSELAWTPGRRLVALGPQAVATFLSTGQGLRAFGLSDGRFTALDPSPDGRRIAFVTTARGRSEVGVAQTAAGNRLTVFSGSGLIDAVTWSPDGRWLLLNWASADQWLFVRVPAKKLVAVSNIRATYGAGTRFAGWCCP